MTNQEIRANLKRSYDDPDMDEVDVLEHPLRATLKTFLDEFMLGEVWFNQEEAGLVAKTS